MCLHARAACYRGGGRVRLVCSCVSLCLCNDCGLGLGLGTCLGLGACWARVGSTSAAQLPNAATGHLAPAASLLLGVTACLARPCLALKQAAAWNAPLTFRQRWHLVVDAVAQWCADSTMDVVMPPSCVAVPQSCACAGSALLTAVLTSCVCLHGAPAATHPPPNSASSSPLPSRECARMLAGASITAACDCCARCCGRWQHLTSERA